MATKDRRKEMRMGLNLPVRARGFAAGADWEEMTTSDDASFGGASFVLKRSVMAGHVLHLDVPLPKSFRQYALSEPSYRVYALVRTAAPVPEGTRVGVMFIGKNPPRDFEKNPGGRYLLPSDPKPGPTERRLNRRLDIFVNLRLQRTDGAGSGPREEQTVAENLSKGGARVMTSLMVAKGEVVVVEELGGGDFRSRAEIRNVYIGKDNVPRLNLMFLDGEAPDRLVSAG